MILRVRAYRGIHSLDLLRGNVLWNRLCLRQEHTPRSAQGDDRHAAASFQEHQRGLPRVRGAADRQAGENLRLEYTG